MDAGWVQAATNPIWIEVDGAPIRSAASAEYALAWIDKLQEMADAWPGWRSDAARAHVFALFEEARNVYRRLLNEAEGG